MTDLPKPLRLAGNGEVLITRNSRPARVFIGLAHDEEWFDYQLECEPRVLRRIAAARRGLHAGKRVPGDKTT
jgi:hypothetical protein